MEVRTPSEVISEKSDDVASYMGDGVIVPEGRTIVFGPTESYKSFFTQQCCVSLAAGRDFLVWHVPQPIIVHYIQFEIPRNFFHDRTETFHLEYGALDDRVNYSALRSFKLKEDKHWAELTAACLRSKADLIAIDPLRSVLYGNENDSEAMTLFTDGVDKIQSLLMKAGQGASFMVVHHTGKPKKDLMGNKVEGDMYDVRGASVLVDWADTVIRVSRIRDKAEVTEITIEKSRNAVGDRDPKFWATLENGLLVPSKVAPDLIVKRLLREREMIHTTELYQLVADEAEVGTNKVRDIVKSMVRGREVVIERYPNDRKKRYVKLC